MRHTDIGLYTPGQVEILLRRRTCPVCARCCRAWKARNALTMIPGENGRIIVVTRHPKPRNTK